MCVCVCVGGGGGGLKRNLPKGKVAISETLILLVQLSGE